MGEPGAKAAVGVVAAERGEQFEEDELGDFVRVFRATDNQIRRAKDERAKMAVERGERFPVRHAGSESRSAERPSVRCSFPLIDPSNPVSGYARSIPRTDVSRDAQRPARRIQRAVDWRRGSRSARLQRDAGARIFSTDRGSSRHPPRRRRGPSPSRAPRPADSPATTQRKSRAAIFSISASRTPGVKRMSTAVRARSARGSPASAFGQSSTAVIRAPSVITLSGW